MTMTEKEAFDKLIDLTPQQLDYLVVQLELDRRFMRNTQQRVDLATDILHLLRSRSGWLDELERALKVLYDSTQSYLRDRLAPIRKFLVEPPPNPGEVPMESGGTVKELRKALAALSSPLQRPERIKDVSGTLFPALLLTEGWWERKKADKALHIEDPLQRWLFKGFDLWAPSWDISWDFENRQAIDTSHYFIAQLTDGDEADSLRVIVPGEMARQLRDEFRDSWGGFEVKISGRLGHKYQFEKEVPEGLEGELQDFYIWLERYKRLGAKTDLYSGYLWKCLAPSKWLEENALLGLDKVYFVWEHTNFAAKDAVQYNLDSLLHKEALIAKRHPGSELVLLQKSHAIVPGDPRWPTKQFIDLLAGELVSSKIAQGKKSPAP